MVFPALKDCNISYNVSMREHTTFRIGGTVREMLSPLTPNALIDVVRAMHEKSISPLILGRGSNLLFRDGTLPITVISTTAIGEPIHVTDNTLSAHAGTPLSKLAVTALENGLTGLEFAHGIPGTLGGAVIMNAGAYGGEIGGVIKSVNVLNTKDELVSLSAAECEFSYRHSLFSEGGYTIVSAEIELSPLSKDTIAERMRELGERRRSKQPLELPSAGSTFKRPPGGYAAELIDKCGLRGFTVGGAAVSTKHAGFIVNTGSAAFSDVLAVIKHVQKTVFDKTGIMLEPEIKII